MVGVYGWCTSGNGRGDGLQSAAWPDYVVVDFECVPPASSRVGVDHGVRISHRGGVGGGVCVCLMMGACDSLPTRSRRRRSDCSLVVCRFVVGLGECASRRPGRVSSAGARRGRAGVVSGVHAGWGFGGRGRIDGRLHLKGGEADRVTSLRRNWRRLLWIVGIPPRIRRLGGEDSAVHDCGQHCWRQRWLEEAMARARESLRVWEEMW